MLVDSFNRKIDYLRVSVTDRCNLRCIYCMPVSGIIHKPHDQILTYEEVIRLANIFALLGITKIRLTGGEPLVRKGIPGLIKELTNIEGITDVSLTTNGILLKDYAAALKISGLKRLNISLDSLDDQRYNTITRGGDVTVVKEGIKKAIELGFSPVKINVLLFEGINQSEVDDFLRLTIGSPIHIRFLEFMPRDPEFSAAIQGVPSDKILESSRQFGSIEPIELHGNGPAKMWRFKGARGTFGLISPMSDKFCASCNRLRITSSGQLMGCLHSDKSISLRESLRDGASEKEIIQLIKIAVDTKSEEHSLDRETLHNYQRSMCQIGG